MPLLKAWSHPKGFWKGLSKEDAFVFLTPMHKLADVCMSTNTHIHTDTHTHRRTDTQPHVHAHKYTVYAVKLV